MITRRGFLAALAGLVAAPVLLKSAPAVAPTTVNSAHGSDWTVALTKGDVFTIEGVYAVNPRTLVATEHLQRFIVTADVSSGPFVPIEVIHPPIVRTGMYQNVYGIDPVDPQRHTVPMRLIRPVGWSSTRGAVKVCSGGQRVTF